MDTHFCEPILVEVAREYGRICFSTAQGCFYALDACNGCLLYRLDEQLCEMECISLCNNMPLCGVCVDDCGGLLVSGGSTVYHLERPGALVPCEHMIFPGAQVGQISRVQGLCVVSLMRGDTATLSLLQVDGRWIMDGEAPLNCTIEGLHCRQINDCDVSTIALYTPCDPDKSSFLAPLSLPISLPVPQVDCTNQQKENPCMNTPDHQMSQNCDTCPNHPARGCCTIRFCESEISISCCGSFWKPTGSGGCEMVLESIALAETAIAHILNAEGEKIQKILAICDDPQIILEVNRAVVQTITRVTQLEQTLLGKLQALEHYQKISTTPCDPCC